MGSKGRRYDAEPKLNMKKVIAVIVAIIIIIMFIYFLKGLFSQNKPNTVITSKSYFPIYQDEKWGVLDSNGDIVINPSYEEMVIIPDPKTDIFLCTYDVDYSTGNYKTKAINAKNEEILTQYENIEALANKDNNHLWYEQNVLKVGNAGKFGTINYEGKEILPIEYEEITPILGIENNLLIKKEGKYGVATNDGKIIIEPKYAEISALGKNKVAGYIVKDENEKYGIIGVSSKEILPNQYDGITDVYGNDLYVVEKAKKQILIDKEGTEILSEGFDKISQILKNKDTGIIFQKNNKYGVMKTTGEVTLDAKYDSLEEAKSEIFIYKQDEKYGIMDITGQVKIEPQYTNITYEEKADIYIAEKENYEADILDNTFATRISGMVLECNTETGYIKMLENDQTKYYTFHFEEKQEKDIFPNRTLFVSKKDGKYGFVDKDGNVVVDYQYDDATEQNDYGYAGIKKDANWGSINNEGKVIQEPKYDLEDYILVNFIGKWHIGQDVYMNYYNQE